MMSSEARNPNMNNDEGIMNGLHGLLQPAAPPTPGDGDIPQNGDNEDDDGLSSNGDPLEASTDPDTAARDPNAAVGQDLYDPPATVPQSVEVHQPVKRKSEENQSSTELLSKLETIVTTMAKRRMASNSATGATAQGMVQPLNLNPGDPWPLPAQLWQQFCEKRTTVQAKYPKPAPTAPSPVPPATTATASTTAGPSPPTTIKIAKSYALAASGANHSPNFPLASAISGRPPPPQIIPLNWGHTNPAGGASAPVPSASASSGIAGNMGPQINFSAHFGFPTVSTSSSVLPTNPIITTFGGTSSATTGTPLPAPPNMSAHTSPLAQFFGNPAVPVSSNLQPITNPGKSNFGHSGPASAATSNPFTSSLCNFFTNRGATGANNNVTSNSTPSGAAQSPNPFQMSKPSNSSLCNFFANRGATGATNNLPGPSGSAHSPHPFQKSKVEPSPTSKPTAPIPRKTSLPIVEAEPPKPPNWDQHLDDTVMSFSRYKTFPIVFTSPEFQTIAHLLDPFEIISVDQIVNPDVFKRFLTMRKEMLRTKSEDLNLLKKLGWDDKEIQQKAHLSKNFMKDPLLTTEAARYTPNETLLFHCTRKEGNLENILSEGLDERMSSSYGGILGKGIYFADDPMKSILYDRTGGTILIFAVLLGDCLAVHEFHHMRSFVREPEKEIIQKRHFTDHYFDSITARPNGYNEYVVYNRAQCCPLYIVKYGKNTPGRIPNKLTRNYTTARRTTPTFSWNPMPLQVQDKPWPFLAASLFEKMNTDPGPSIPIFGPPPIFAPSPELDVPVTAAPKTFLTFGKSNPAAGAGGHGQGNNTTTTASIPPVPSTSTSAFNLNPGLVGPQVPSEKVIKERIAAIIDALGLGGYHKEATIRHALARFNFDADKAANLLLSIWRHHPLPTTPPGCLSNTVPVTSSAIGVTGNNKTENRQNPISAQVVPTASSQAAAAQPQPQPSTSRRNDMDMDTIATRTIDLTINSQEDKDAKEECTICYEEYGAFSHSPHLWEELHCGHKLCLDCFNNIETTRATMSKTQKFTSVKCPFCQKISGILVGTCPDGFMNLSIIQRPCEGHPNYQTYQIEYRMEHRGLQFKRIAYIPASPEGQQVLNLLKIAWGRRLIFVIGTSNTTGEQNVPVWNIHHKTRLDGGAASHGYPDPGYFERAREELKTVGVERAREELKTVGVE